MESSSREREVGARLLRAWSNLTSLLIILFSVWAFLYARVGPMWKHENEIAAARTQFYNQLAAGAVFTACIFELLTVMLESRVYRLPSKITVDDSKIVLVMYLVLALNYLKMASSEDWVHTDPLAFGGPRPVYTLRYLERSICMPLLLSIASTSPAAQKLKTQTEVSDEAGEGSDVRQDKTAWQLRNLLSIPSVIRGRLQTMSVAASARCVVVYTWCSWLALVVQDEFARWFLINVYFVAFSVASVEQCTHCVMMYRYDNNIESALLLFFQVVVAGFYAAIFIVAAFGCISWQEEQIIYTFLDVMAKLVFSAYITSRKRRRNRNLLLSMRRVASNAAEDIQRLIRQANVPILSLSRDLMITEWNMKMADVSGIPKEAAVRMHLSEVLTDEEEWHSTGTWMANALSGRDGVPGAVRQVSFRRAAVNDVNDEEVPPTVAGSESCIISLSTTCQRNLHGGVTGVLCVGSDVTELLRASKAYKSMAESLSRLLDSANAPIIEVDTEFRIVWWNSWMVNKTGVPSAKIRGKPLKLLSPMSEPALRKALQSQQAEGFELCLSDVDNRPTALLLTATQHVAAGKQGAHAGVICFGQDITMLKDFGNRKSALMNMVSERLKAPLDQMIELARTGFEEEELSPEYSKPLGMISNCASRLMEMVSNIKSAAELSRNKPLALNPGPVQLQTIVDEVMVLCDQSVKQRLGGQASSSGMQRKPKLKLTNKVDAPLPIIEADANCCTQLIYNLVANAVKFTHEGYIECSASDDKERKEVTIHVKDTGIGIAQENLSRIFEPFDQEDISESRRYSGLGLGLAISREIARKHGGDITVVSEQGQGSTFSATLPYKMTPQPKPAAAGGMKRMPSVKDSNYGDPELETVEAFPGLVNKGIVGAWLHESEQDLPALAPMEMEKQPRHGLDREGAQPRMLSAQPRMLSGISSSNSHWTQPESVEAKVSRELPTRSSAPWQSSGALVAEQTHTPSTLAMTETARQMKLYQEEEEAARKQSAKLQKRIEELERQILERRRGSDETREQKKGIQQSMLKQRHLGMQQRELLEHFSQLEKVQIAHQKLLSSREEVDVEVLSRVDLTAVTPEPRSRDPALRVVEEEEATSQRHLKRVMEIAQTLQHSEKEELLHLAYDFAEDQGLLLADLGQKSYFLRSRQERLQNHWLQLGDIVLAPTR